VGNGNEGGYIFVLEFDRYVPVPKLPLTLCPYEGCVVDGVPIQKELIIIIDKK
jgi:hypothetical protein